MSSSAPEGAAVPKGKKGFGKVLSRVKTVLRRGEGSSSKRQSTLATKPEPIKESEPAAPLKVAEKSKYENQQGVTKLTKNQMFEERAKKLAERYGLELKPSDWHTGSPDDTVLRMDKPIRMRVRRTCHRCNANFTSAKECPNCQHVRCTKCTRYPPKRTEAELVASRERRAAIIKANKENAPIIPDYDYAFKKEKIVLTRPSKTGGQDLVHKKPRQRVRRTCHECQTLFTTGSKQCASCGHARCTDCPRDPPKKDKYPYGYPGDEFGPNSIPHYECTKCKVVYTTGAENGTPCKKCGTEKSGASPRALPRKVEPEPDPEVLKRLQARLGNLSIT